MAGLMRPQEPGARVPTGFALGAPAFRPFHLLASIFGAPSIVLWAAGFGLDVVPYWPVPTGPWLGAQPG